MAPSPALDARSLARTFGGHKAVRGVSLQVHPGEIVGLLGPNGAGKTTTLRMLAGILAPDQGSVAVAGIPLSERPLEAKARIGFLSGDTRLYQRLTPREVLAYFGSLYGMERARLAQRIDAVVEELAMGDFAHRPCGTLSSGQRQRANIARAFLHEPDVLILDEPTNALDVVSGRFIAESVRKAREAGRAVLFSTHVISEAEYLCDRMYIIGSGQVRAEGTREDLLAMSQTSNLTDALLRLVEASPERGL